jgi:transitional endoplasmic reticulum ATPase
MTGTFRPSVETVERDGWRLEVVDLSGLLAAASYAPVEVLFDLPGSSVTLSIHDSEVTIRATVHSGRDGSGGPFFTVLGNGPLGTLLRRGVEAGDERAVRVVSGLRTAVDGLNRLGRRNPPEGPPESGEGVPRRTAIDIDEPTGLRTTVTEYPPTNSRRGAAPDRRLVLQATVATGVLTAEHLAAFVDVLIRTVGLPEGFRSTLTLTSRRSGSRSTLDQVGGLDPVVAQFRDIAATFRNPAAMSRWGARRPQGILLYGPPGTGKTMLARALAEEIGGTLREVRTPEILDKWLGASERNMKRIFREARQVTEPTVLLFDEFDSIISYAGAGTDSGSHAVNAVAGIFKQEMNSLVEANPYVIVVATTNFPGLIDSSLVRSGRFDIKLQIPVPDERGRAQILTRMIRDLIASNRAGADFHMFAEDVDVEALAAAAHGMTGADLREVLRRAQMAKAMEEARSGRPAGPIGQEDLRAGIERLRQG